MRTEDRDNSRSVPRLLVLLASSVEQAIQAAAPCSHSKEQASWGRHRAAEVFRHHDHTSDRKAEGFSKLRIRRLRRAYNILLFDGPSHNEIIEQAVLEDSNSSSSGKTPEGTQQGGDIAGLSIKNSDKDNALVLITSTISAACLDLRRARRYDPANALEGLIDGLISKHSDNHCLSSISGILRLFVALRQQGWKDRDQDDWEVIGGQGRQVLQRLYTNSCAENSSISQDGRGQENSDNGLKQLTNSTSAAQQQERQEQRNSRVPAASLPVAMFFREGQGSGTLHRPHYNKVEDDFPVTAAAISVEDSRYSLNTEPPAAKTTPIERYLLPNDCILHGDSNAAETASSSVAHRGAAPGFGVEHMPWFTDTEFSSERGIPDMSQSSSLHGYLKAMTTAPLSPAAWTKTTGGNKVAYSSTAWSSGGAPAVKAGASNGSSDPNFGDSAAKQTAGYTIDLCGALGRARVDVRSPVVRELQVALSFPDLLDSCPTDLLEMAQVQLSGSTDPTSSEANGGEGSISHTAPIGFTRHPILAKIGMAMPLNVAQRREAMPQLRDGSTEEPSEGYEPTGGYTTISGQTGGLKKGIAALGLNPVGWEETEADWNDPSVPKWALASTRLVTFEGGAGSKAFELCYREHFEAGMPGLEGQLPATAEVEMVRRALAALQGIPSDIFWYDEKYARMGVEGEEVWLPRVAGFSPGSLSSLLKEFATAGTWYRRVEEFATYLVDKSTMTGQVAQALGVELRRQLAVLQASILGVTLDLAGVGQNAATYATEEGTLRAREGLPGDVGGPHPARHCTLAGALFRTIELRREVGGIAEICGLASRELRTVGGVRAVFRAFPRGASLLTYLYKAAEVRAASSPEGAGRTGGIRTVVKDNGSALALLSSAAAPYLTMLSRWLWSGEMWAEDDPFGEFPLHCRESLASGDGDDWNGKEPGMEDGGGSFMALGFRENTVASVPCFLEGGVLAAAARAGKLLRMLKLSSLGFYAACAASPPPPLTLVFGSRALASRVAVFSRLSLLREVAGRSVVREYRARTAEEELRKGAKGGRGGEKMLEEEKSALGALDSQRKRDHAFVEEARKIWVHGLEEDKTTFAAAAAAATAAAEKRSLTAISSGRGIMSFLEPPTSEAEALAAAALRERYRFLGDEADARAARARWKCQRSERAVAARSSLKVLYATEAQMWKAEADEATASRDSAENEESAGGQEGVAGVSVLTETNSGDGDDKVFDDTIKAEAGGKCTVNGNHNASVEVKAAEVDDTLSRGPSVPEPKVVSLPTQSLPLKNSSEAILHSIVDVDNVTGTSHADRLSPPSNLVTEADSIASKIAGYENKKHQDEVNFSHVTIVDEPGGKSANASAALGNWPGKTWKDSCVPTNDTPLKFSHINIVRDPGGSSFGVSQALRIDVGRDGDSAESPAQESVSRTTQDPGGNLAGASSTMTFSSIVHATDGNNTRPVRSSESKLSGGHDDLETRPTTVREPSKNSPLANASIAAEVTAATGEEAICNQRRDLRQDPHDSKSVQDGAVVTASEARVKARLGEGGEGLEVPAGEAVGTNCPNLEAAKAHEGVKARHLEDTPEKATTIDQNTAHRRRVVGNRPKGLFLPDPKEGKGAEERRERYCSLPLDVLVRRCVREPVLAQCGAIDSSALAFLVRGAGVAEHLASLRRFLLGLNSGFLHDFTLRLLEGLYDSGINWRRISNLNAAFAASATAAGLDSVPLAKTFRYEVDSTCGGVLGSSFVDVRDSESNDIVHSPIDVVSTDVYSPAALSFVSPVLAVPWPVGVLLPKGVLHTYGSIHRSLFRHQVVLHRLRRLRLTLRELDVLTGASRGSRRGARRAGGKARVSWDKGRLHWLHLFRHEMQHMADSLQTFFAEQAEAGWPELRRSLSAAEGAGFSPRADMARGGLAFLVAAHSRYISNMFLHMFLGNDRPSIVARAQVEEFYEVVCTVSRVTDGLLLAPSVSGDVQKDEEETNLRRVQDIVGEMVLPNEAFAELASVRGRFDAAKRELCGALLEISAAGGGARARPLLAILGYGGYGGGDVA